jgi:acetyl esterase
MGESAGGNLSAVVCLLARDRGGPVICHQALIYPATDMTAHGSQAEPAVAQPFLSPEEMTAYRRMYLGADGDPADPMASPLLADDHGKLPPALIQVAEHDPLRPEGMRYAAALRAAGVPVRLTTYVGMPHGFLNFPGLSRSAPQALAELCAEQAVALAPVEEATA